MNFLSRRKKLNSCRNRLIQVVGIDLGTTNSVIATIQGRRPVVIPTQDGSATVPSVVSFVDRKSSHLNTDEDEQDEEGKRDEDELSSGPASASSVEILVGEDAKNQVGADCVTKPPIRARKRVWKPACLHFNEIKFKSDPTCPCLKSI